MSKTIETTPKSNKANLGILIGAAFMMATSAIGPGFLTQTASFTNSPEHGGVGASFGFVILVSVILALVVQVNVWRAICVSGLRGQDLANKVLPGLGYAIAALVAIGGLAFNIGNVGGAALGLNALLGVDVKIGYIVCGLFAIMVFAFKNAKIVVDNLVKILGVLMILIIFAVIFISKPPMGTALKETFLPSQSLGKLTNPILTLLGGTVGGYITFSGAHRLIDAGIVGKNNLKEINKSSIWGMSIATLTRFLLFLAVLGVSVTGVNIMLAESNPMNVVNPAASTFYNAAGDLGFRFFGLVLLSAAITSIVGAAYTSVSFLKTLNKTVDKNENIVTICFIAVSTLIMFLLGNPSKLLLIVGTLNGLILPITLGTCLLALSKKDIMGEYKHPLWLYVSGGIVFLITTFLSGSSIYNFIITLVTPK